MRLLSASNRVSNSVWRLFAASYGMAMLILGAAAETAPPPSAQSQNNAAIAAWGVTGSAPQTGSSAYTSGRAFKAPNGEQGTTASESQAKPIAPSTPAEQSTKTAGPPAAKILVVIDKPTQQMKVFVGDVERYSWKVSTGKRGYDTPSGTYTARSMNEIWYSKQWDDAPMPHAIFFTRKGHAIHGTEETKKLGRPASHGCVRLAPENASTLFALVKVTGLANTDIVLNGDTPTNAVKVANQKSPKQQLRVAKKTAKIVVKKKKPSSEPKLARSEPRNQPRANTQRITAEQQVKPSRQFVNSKFDPYSLGTPRRLSRRDWMRLYYSGTAQVPPPGYYRAVPAPQVYRRYQDAR
jgi:lipoprotein-anchoring transpeptidase ErfK/SrfK